MQITLFPLLISFGVPPKPNIRPVTIDDFPDPLGPINKFNFGWAVNVIFVIFLQNAFIILNLFYYLINMFKNKKKQKILAKNKLNFLVSQQ